MRRFLFLLIAIIFLTGCVTADIVDNETPMEESTLSSTPSISPEPTVEVSVPTADDTTEISPALFVRAKGQDLVVGENEERIYLRGINFSNYIWNLNHAELLAVHHHQQSDYERIAEMGMNVVRLNLSTYHFESDDAPFLYHEDGWEWLDQEIAWAKEAGVYLILNIHFAPGMSADNEIDFWQNPDNRNRVIEVWRQIAKRYKDETIIAGYDLFNEPEPPSEAVWRDFVTAMVAAIREEDTNHLIVLEAILGLRDEDGNWSAAESPFVALDDSNVMYDFHFYLPFEFTHQMMEYAGIYSTYSYPNERIFYDWDHMQWEGSQSSEALHAGTTDWQLYSGVPQRLPDDSIVLGKPNPFCSRLGDGNAYFADFVIKAWDQNGTYVKDVMHGFVDADQTWWFWSEDGSGNWGMVEDIPVDDSVISTQAIQFTEIQKNATVSNADFGLELDPDYQYSIEGWMKGDNISAQTSCQFSLEWYSLSEGEPVIHENRDYLEKEIEKFLAMAAGANVPVNMGEFGVNWYGWQEGRGAEQWYADMFSIADDKGLNFQIWAYHDIFGPYTAWNVYPDEQTSDQINQAMLDALVELFGQLEK